MRLAALTAVLILMPLPALAAGSGLPPLVRDIGYSLLLAGVLAVLFTRFRIPSIAAFLGAGILAGPQGLKLVTDPGNIDTISQLGFVLLLFVIGLEIDLRQLIKSGRTVLVSGLLQYPLTVLFGFGVAHLMLWLGVGTGLLGSSPFGTLYMGILIAGSSTLLVVQLFAVTFSLDTVAGRACLSMLIFQDIWAIIVIALQPSFAHPAIGPVMASLGGIAVLAGISALIARYVTRPAFTWIAKAPELMLVAALAWCFIVLMVGMHLDLPFQYLVDMNPHISVGAGMGALIAGASLASSPFSTEMVSKVGVVRDFFIVLFFVGLGMMIPKVDSVEILIVAICLAVAALLARMVIFFPLKYLAGMDRRNAMVSSVRLGQISEFALIVAFLGVQEGHIDSNLGSAVILAFIMTALITPVLFRRAHAMHEAMASFLDFLGFKAPSSGDDQFEDGASLVLLGFHRFASSLLHDLSLMHPRLVSRTLVVDFNVSLHEAIRREGARVLYGNLANTETLHHAHLNNAKVIVLTIPDEMLVGTNNVKLVEAAREMNHRASIIVCATRLDEIDDLYEAGADYVYVPRLEASSALSKAIGFALNGQIKEYREDEAVRVFPPRLRDEVFR
jgi:Kef-type K+ transport system membrane component KefB/Trk K+ transport system NAD-binding subunit